MYPAAKPIDLARTLRPMMDPFGVILREQTTKEQERKGATEELSHRTFPRTPTPNQIRIFFGGVLGWGGRSAPSGVCDIV